MRASKACEVDVQGMNKTCEAYEADVRGMNKTSGLEIPIQPIRIKHLEESQICD